MAKRERMLLVCIIFLVLGYHVDCHAQSAVPLIGSGSYEEPYLIQSLEDLIWFKDSVNEGENFSGKYFRQTENIDLAGAEWEPVGIFGSENYFEGYYDGTGHYVANLNMTREDNCAFFGVLAGTVMNFGIESGSITGACTASIAGHAQGENVLVINCYNKANVTGYVRAGGIVDNFAGDVCNCVNMGQLEAPITGEISSYNVNRAIYCYGLNNDLYPMDVFSGWEYQCGAFRLGNPETKQAADQLTRNAYWLKQDVMLSLGELCYWNYTDGEIRFAEKDGYNDFKYAGKLFGAKIVCIACIILSGCFVVMSVVRTSEKRVI